MPKLAADLTMLFNEVDFLDRFAVAASPMREQRCGNRDRGYSSSSLTALSLAASESTQIGLTRFEPLQS
jgi:hypothetical protein